MGYWITPGSATGVGGAIVSLSVKAGGVATGGMTAAGGAIGVVVVVPSPVGMPGGGATGSVGAMGVTVTGAGGGGETP